MVNPITFASAHVPPLQVAVAVDRHMIDKVLNIVRDRLAVGDRLNIGLDATHDIDISGFAVRSPAFQWVFGSCAAREKRANVVMVANTTCKNECCCFIGVGAHLGSVWSAHKKMYRRYFSRPRASVAAVDSVGIFCKAAIMRLPCRECKSLPLVWNCLSFLMDGLTKAGFDKGRIWDRMEALVFGGQEDAPEKMSRRAFLCARGSTCCLHGSAGRFFDN